MKEKIKTIWHYTVLIVSALIIIVQSIKLLTNLIDYNWYGVLIDIVIISLFLYIIWNRFFKKRQLKIKTQKGFIQIPILIAIIIGILVIGGGGYLGYNQFKNYQIQKTEKEKLIQEMTKLQQEKQKEEEKNTEGLEIENLKEEIEELKKQQEQESNEEKSNNLSNTAIIQKIKPAVVYVETPYGSGSGMIIENGDYILTNAHVVKETSLIKIYLLDGRVFDVARIATDENLDIAILKINANNLPVVEFDDSNRAQQGDEIFTFGYPFGIKEDVSFKEGTISRRLTDEKGITYIEISAEIHPGNSGGPLVNRFGKVVGINTGKFGDSINGILLGESIKFAIPINVATNLIPYLKSNTKDFSNFADCILNKARGFVNVFNETDTSRKLIPSRLVSDSGLLFWNDESVLIPGARVVGGKLTPGQVTVSVTADQRGAEYKIGPSIFSLPALIGSSFYTKIYAKSYKAMTCE